MRAIALIGLVAACGRSNPGFDRPAAAVVITARWPGHPPHDALLAIGSPIDRELVLDPNVAHVSTTCRTDGCVITGLLRGGADATAVAQRMMGVSRGLASKLPPDLEATPGVAQRVRGDTVRVQIGKPGLDDVALRELVSNDVELLIERMPGVTAVDMCGGATPRLLVQADPARLAHFALRLEDVEAAVAGVNFGAPTGVSDGPRRDLTLATSDDHDAEALAAAVVAMRAGAPVHIGELARVIRDAVPVPCAVPAPGHVVLDARVTGSKDTDIAVAIGTEVRQRVRADGLELAVGPAPARYAIAFTAGGSSAEAGELADRWRAVLASTPGIEVEPPPARSELSVPGRRASILFEKNHELPVYVGLITARPSPLAEDRCDSFDRVRGVTLHVVIGDDDPDRVARAALARAREAAPPPLSSVVYAWREP